MRLWPTLLLLALAAPLAAPLAAQTGGGTTSCELAAGFECNTYVQRFGADSAERRVAKVIAIWRMNTQTAQAGAPLDPLRQSAVSLEYRRRTREAEDKNQISMGGTTGLSMHLVTISREPPTPGRIYGELDSVFVAGQGFEIPAGDTAIVLLMNRGEVPDEPAPTVNALYVMGRMGPSGERMWRNGDTTFIVRPQSNRRNLPYGFETLPSITAFMRESP